MSPKPYKPVSCAFLDLVENWAIQKIKGKIVFINDLGNSEEIIDSIQTWTSANQEEFLVTTSGRKIRLDKITALFGYPQDKIIC